MYYIYHIPGIKIGCTYRMPARIYEQGYTEWEILEEHEDIYVASDRETELQIQYDYSVDSIPYYESLSRGLRGLANVKDENRVCYNSEHQKHASSFGASKAGKIGGPIGGKLGGKTQGNINAKNGHMNKMWEKSLVNKTCPHCNKNGKGPVMHRYHFDNCKQKKGI